MGGDIASRRGVIVVVVVVVVVVDDFPGLMLQLPVRGGGLGFPGPLQPRDGGRDGGHSRGRARGVIGDDVRRHRHRHRHLRPGIIVHRPLRNLYFLCLFISVALWLVSSVHDASVSESFYLCFVDPKSVRGSIDKFGRSRRRTPLQYVVCIYHTG